MKKKYLLFFLIPALLFASTYYSLPYLKQRPYLTVVGPIKMADGLGRQTVELMDAFYDDFTMNCCPTTEIRLQDVPKRIHKFLATRRFRPAQGGRIVFFEQTLLGRSKDSARVLKKIGPKKSSQIRIAYSMLESSIVPNHTVTLLNQYFDAVAVPDSYLVEVYKNSGVKIPVFTLPLGLNLEPFLNAPLKEKAHTPFCFINSSACEPRKNYEGLFLAFKKAFGDDPNVVLRSNFRVHYFDALEKAIATLNQLNCNNIVLTDFKLDNQEYRDFLAQGDVFVSLSKGEGFSIIPREAMALGMPVLISNNTTHTTIIDSGLAHGVSCPHEQILLSPRLGSLNGKNFSADIDEAAVLMRQIYDHYQEELGKAAERREWARQYQFSYLKERYRNMIKPKTILLGDRNEVTDEALITDSKELYEKYLKVAR